MNDNYNHGKLIQSDVHAANVALSTGQYNLLGKYVVKAGEIIFPGFGDSENMHDAIGRAYAILQTSASAEIKGTWLIQIESAQDIPLKVLGTWRSEDFNTSSTDKTKQIPFPKMNTGISKDKKVAFYFKPDAAATTDYTKCVLNFDITRLLV